MRTICFTLLVACTGAPRPFPLRAPLMVDSDRTPVSFACKPAPTAKDPHRVSCMPEVYTSSLAWDALDNTIFARLSRGLSLDIGGEATNANSLDEVAESSWFENRAVPEPEQVAIGACSADDILPRDVPDGAWVIDHGKDDGSTLGFRIDVPGKGRYLLKADDPAQPERGSAASVIGAALYYAIGFNTSCEQVVYLRPAQLRLLPGLTVTGNTGSTTAFDAKALAHVLASSPHRGDLIRMQASKWLPGESLGPFRYDGTRHDDPNDVVPHEDRRELRGSRLLAAWMNHYDTREQNSLAVWIASDPEKTRSSPGYIRHYYLDTSDVIGGNWDPDAMTSRLGNSYYLDFADIGTDLISFGAIVRPWERARIVHGREKFGYFSTSDFDPETWKSGYPNPAFLRMTERDAAWMARRIARLSPDHVRAIAAAGQFSDATDVDYLTTIFLERQRSILQRYFARLSPLADAGIGADGAICATDLARVRGVFPADRFAYDVVELAAGRRTPLAATADPSGRVCFTPRSAADSKLRDDDPRRIVIFEARNRASAGPLEIHTYDLGARGFRIVGLVRPER